MSDSETSVYVRTPSPEPKKKSTKNIKKRKSSSSSRSDFEATAQRSRTPSPTPSAQKKKAVKASTSNKKKDNSDTRSSKQSAGCDIFKIIRDEEINAGVQHLKIPKTTSSFTSRVSSGSSRRTAVTDGNFFIDLKIYNIEDYQKTSPEERYKKSLAAVKLQCKENSLEWDKIQMLLGQAFTIFESCEPVYFQNYKKQ